MVAEFDELKALDIWRRAIIESVRLDAPDLSARQMSLLLSVYLTPASHTVRGLANLLKVSKPAITRAVNRLTGLIWCVVSLTQTTNAVFLFNAPSGVQHFCVNFAT